MNAAIFIMTGIFGVIFIGIALFVNHKAATKKRKNLSSLITNRQAVNHNPLNIDETKTAVKQEKSPNKTKFSKKLKNVRDGVAGEELKLKSIRYMLIQAGSDASVLTFWMWSCVSGVLFFAGAYLMGYSQITVILWAFTGFFGFPRYILKKKVARRQKKFLEEFADSLDGMIRLLKSGMPITEAIAMTSREYEGPIGQEMTKVYEDQRVGDTLPDAVQKMAFRMPIPEVKMFSTAITIQVQTGASLSEILQNLSNVIRQRFRLKRKIQSLSAEAKISAGIIGALPLVVVIGMYFGSPDYIALLWTHSSGKMMMYGAIGWMSIGILMMKSMINFKV